MVFSEVPSPVVEQSPLLGVVVLGEFTYSSSVVSEGGSVGSEESSPDVSDISGCSSPGAPPLDSEGSSSLRELGSESSSGLSSGLLKGS